MVLSLYGSDEVDEALALATLKRQAAEEALEAAKEREARIASVDYATEAVLTAVGKDHESALGCLDSTFPRLPGVSRNSGAYHPTHRAAAVAAVSALSSVTTPPHPSLHSPGICHGDIGDGGSHLSSPSPRRARHRAHGTTPPRPSPHPERLLNTHVGDRRGGDITPSPRLRSNRRIHESPSSDSSSPDFKPAAKKKFAPSGRTIQDDSDDNEEAPSLQTLLRHAREADELTEMFRTKASTHVSIHVCPRRVQEADDVTNVS